MHDRAYGHGSRRRRVAFGMAVVLAVLGAVGFGAYKAGVLHRAPFRPGVGQTDAAATQVGEGQGREPGDAEPSRTAQPPAACAGALPKRVRFDDPNIPTGELGEWVEVKNDEGKVALRFKVDLLDAKDVGTLRVGEKTSPAVLGLFGIHVENRSCEELKWNTRRPGFWVGTKKRIDKIPARGWIHVDSHSADKLFVPHQGSFYNVDDRFQRIMKNRIQHKFNGRWPVEFPESVRPGDSAYGEFFIEIIDVLGIDAVPSLGPEGDGNLPLVIGGYQSWAKINLGSAASWYEKFVGDPRDASTRTARPGS